MNVLYQFKFKKLQLTSQFTLQSGRALTVPIFVGYSNTPFYSLRNEYRLPLFHKLDIGFQYNIMDKPKFKQILQFHLYNVYARKNIYAVIYDKPPTAFSTYEFHYFSLFPFLPSFSYQIKF